MIDSFAPFAARHASMAVCSEHARLRKAMRGFTLIEMLVVIAIIAILVSLAIPALRSVRRSATQTVEMSAARQLTLAYNSYALDNNGALMPGYFQPAPNSVHDASGHVITGEPAKRYPWRLAPYLDYDLKGLYLDSSLIEALSAQQTLYTYLISLYPSMGMNTWFVGGDTHAIDDYSIIASDFHLKRLSQARHPAELIVFASARSDQPFAPGIPPLIEGFFKVTPPYMTARLWTPTYEPAIPPGHAADFGFVSLRHAHRSAVVGHLDGSAGVYDEAEIQDMRHWADQATAPDWTLQQGSGP